jgi:hypothetical protein
MQKIEQGCFGPAILHVRYPLRNINRAAIAMTNTMTPKG